MVYREKMPDGTTRLTGASSGATGPTGATGPQGNPGTNGTNGVSPTLLGTSVTSTSIATGSKTFAIAPSMPLAFPVGSVVRAYSAANPNNYMTGMVTASAVNSVTINVTEIGGTGTFADWVLVISGFIGPAGVSGNAARPWNQGITYVTNDVVGFAGRMWRASQAVPVNKCPPLFQTYWQPIHGYDYNGWVSLDPDFDADDKNIPWQFFWQTGGSVSSLTSVAGEFETGKQAVKIVHPANSSQRFYENEENLVFTGEIVRVQVRARASVAAAGVTISADMITNDYQDGPVPFGVNAQTVADTLGAQLLSTTWDWYTFYLVVPGGGRSRAIVNIVSGVTATAANVFVDRYRVSRVSSIPASGVDVWKSVAVTSLVSTATTQVTGFSRLTGADTRCFTFAADAWTCRIPGWYDINFNVNFGGSNTATRRIAFIFVNGAELRRFDASPGGASCIQVCHKAYLDVGDVLDGRAYQNSGANLPLSATGHIMQMQRISS